MMPHPKKKLAQLRRTSVAVPPAAPAAVTMTTFF
jgi:hypothetical protein